MTEEENAAYWQLRYHEAVLECVSIRMEKNRELSQIVSGVVIGAAVLFALWLHHEGEWADRLATAQGYCLIPESDGGCAAWDKSALVAEWQRLGR